MSSKLARFTGRVKPAENPSSTPVLLALCCPSVAEPPAPLGLPRDRVLVQHVAGLHVDDGIRAGVGYAVQVSGVSLVLVLGHADCPFRGSRCEDHVAVARELARELGQQLTTQSPRVLASWAAGGELGLEVFPG